MKMLLAALSSQFKTLKGFFFIATVSTALLVFLGATLTSSMLYEKLIAQQTLEISQGIAKQSFNALYQTLRSGGSRQNLDDAIAADIAAFPKAQRRITVYRGTPIEIIHGPVRQGKSVV